MRHLDLFSGIGGFALATEMVWDDVEHIFCDIDPFCQEILRKHWPNSIIHEDIRKISGDTWQQVDLLTGGFPCQPFSAAGRRRGTEDDRHLWPEMLRIIRECHPTYIVGENVGDLLTWDGGMVFEKVCADLEEAGYEVGAFVIPAAAVGAPHRRDRVWIAAHSIGSDAERTSRLVSGAQEGERLQERDEMGKPSEPSGARVPSDAEHDGRDGAEDGEGNHSGSDRDAQGSDELREFEGTDSIRENAADARREHGEPRRDEGVGAGASERSAREPDAKRRGTDDTDTGNEGLEGREPEDSTRYRGLVSRDGSNEGWDWSQNWHEVAAAFCRVDDGIPKRLDRTPRLKALGNAIVPQVAAEVLRAIRNIHDYD